METDPFLSSNTQEKLVRKVQRLTKEGITLTQERNNLRFVSQLNPDSSLLMPFLYALYPFPGGVPRAKHYDTPMPVEGTDMLLLTHMPIAGNTYSFLIEQEKDSEEHLTGATRRTIEIVTAGAHEYFSIYEQEKQDDGRQKRSYSIEVTNPYRANPQTLEQECALKENIELERTKNTVHLQIQPIEVTATNLKQVESYRDEILALTNFMKALQRYKPKSK